MKEIKKFEASDGKIFDSRSECKLYEKTFEDQNKFMNLLKDGIISEITTSDGITLSLNDTWEWVKENITPLDKFFKERQLIKRKRTNK